MHMLFNFLLNQYMFLELAHREACILQDGLKTLPDLPDICQWLNFVRHHDELALDRLSQTQQEEVFQAFAPDENMRIYGHGIRRRLPPMMNGERRRIELVYSLMFSLPGTPLVRYGEEIGMGEDLSLPGRNSVRTPMQWSDAPNGGFSNAPADALVRSVIAQGEYGYQRVNVASEQRDPNSLINWMERLIRTRKQCQELGTGSWQILETDEPCVFAHCCESQRAVVVLHNLADRACSVTLKLPDDKRLIDLFSGSPVRTPKQWFWCYCSRCIWLSLVLDEPDVAILKFMGCHQAIAPHH
ncbi:hypothetical protein ABN584_26170 [Gloeocapsa sp. BRSZ]